VYVASYSSHNVSVISTALNTVSATITIGAGTTGAPIALAVTNDSAHVYVADRGNAQINDIKTASDTVANTIVVGSMADGNLVGGGDPNILAVTPDGEQLYVASYTAGTVAHIAVLATGQHGKARLLGLSRRCGANDPGSDSEDGARRLAVHRDRHRIDAPESTEAAVPQPPDRMKPLTSGGPSSKRAGSTGWRVSESSGRTAVP
jgi:YVTN family beta-propeller protein